MGEFSAEWLALREPADHAARSASLTRDLIEALPNGSLGILDLGCGTGSNMRYIQATLKGSPDAIDWLLVDSDVALLARVPRAANVTVLRHDLSVLDETLFAGRTFVTASALLDLVSESWVRALAARCKDHGAAALFALTYDGRMACVPEEPEDAIVRDLVNRHQKTDKGFEPALGPDAIACAERAFTGLGYTVRREPSDWVLDSREGAHRELQRQLIEGWAEAAASIAPERGALVEAWRTARLAHLHASRSILTVGHQDLTAIASGPSSLGPDIQMIRSTAGSLPLCCAAADRRSQSNNTSPPIRNTR